MTSLTPMLQQYFKIKKKYADCILFFRLGDFYEMFGEDAKTASAILNITLTARQKGTDNEIPMCGVPYHAVDNYLSKITKEGKKVAICEQVSDPTLPGIVEREVVRVITPGTTLDNNLLSNKKNNFLVCLDAKDNEYFLSYADLTTAEFKAARLKDFDALANELRRLSPSEAILTPAVFADEKPRDFLKDIAVINAYSLEPYAEPYETLVKHFKVHDLKGFGLEGEQGLTRSAATLLMYLKETQKTSLDHLNSLSVYTVSDYLILDEATLRNLDLLCNSYDGAQEASLTGVLDKTSTPMGGRLLRSWIVRPLKSKHNIENRLDAVAFFQKNIEISEELNHILKRVGDIERTLGRIGCGRGNARDLLNLKNSLIQVPFIQDILKDAKSDYIKKMTKSFDPCAQALLLLETAIDLDAPAIITDGGMIKKGYDKELDALKEISSSGKDFIRNLQVKEIKETGINSLKVKFNKVFGYYIEISNTHLASVPERYIRKQTLVNAERFITPELKEFEEKILTAEDKIKQLEQSLFFDIVEKIKPYFLAMQKNAKIIAALDVFRDFASLASLHDYCLPEINEQGIIEIKEGRHPVIEIFSHGKDYIPNDVILDHKDHQLLLITGPNMAGKSSYLRQTALIVLLAHIGSFVPARQANICITDRIFTRVGAADNLAKGLSTFMAEMQEASNILNCATEKSLIILDELGRGTSTYDGVSIAWAIMEYIYHKVKAKTMFATHYHELIDVAEKLEKAQNYAMAVKEEKDEVIFLHQVVKGGISRSYGIEVAKLAGMPQSVVKQAYKYLLELEEKYRSKNFQVAFDFSNGQPSTDKNEYQDVIDELVGTDVNALTPLEALNKISDLKKKCQK